jgi:hypothetical protein
MASSPTTVGRMDQSKTTNGLLLKRLGDESFFGHVGIVS